MTATILPMPEGVNGRPAILAGRPRRGAGRPLPPALMERLVAAVADGVLIVDEEGMIRLVNDAAAALTGYSPGELIGQPLSGLLPRGNGGGSPGWPVGDRGLAPGKAWTGERRIADRHGAILPVALRIVDLGSCDGVRHHAVLLSDPRPRRRDQAVSALLMLHLAQQAATDPLTGLFNRRALDDEARRLFARADRKPRSLAVAVGDLDRFKEINDQFGHPAGDAVLRTVSATMRGSLRLGDVLARIGGEEFALLMPDTDSTAAVALVERLRQIVGAVATVVSGGALLRCTISLGVTGRRPGESWPAVLERADQALYFAKTSGRDHVVAI